MDASEADQRLQLSTTQYPPPPTTNAEGVPDFAQTAAAALLSAPPATTQQATTSQQQSDIQNVAGTPSNPRKRKPAIPGSRGVANLTPEQLSKKRANDREAQRAIRERTKNQIGNLEARIRELESQQPYQEMQRAIAERDRALAECEELRRRLSAVAGIVGSQDLGQMGLNQLAALTAQQDPLPTSPDHHQQQQQQQQPSLEEYNDEATQHFDGQNQPHLHPELRESRSLNGSRPESPA